MPNRSRSWSRKKGSPRLRSAPPTVTVIIPAHNEAESITETVRSCLEQTYKPQRVLVMADACSDDTAELAREAGAEVIEVDFKCKSLCQRAALELVTTDIVVGLDADSTFSPNAIALMVVDLHKGYDATCTTVLPKQEKGLFPRSRALNYAVACRWWRFIEKGLGRLQCISGCGYAMRVKTLRDAGGFAVDAISEDRLTTWDLYAHGARITYTPAALVYTQEPETLKTYYKQLNRWSASWFQVVSIHRKQLVKPNVLLIVLATLWDIITAPVIYLVFLYGLYVHGGGLILLLWLAARILFIVAVATPLLGIKRTLLCIVPNEIVSLLDRGIYFTTFCREWLFGRHYASWTGRQGRKTVITRMRLPRKLTFASSLGLVVLLLPATLAVLPSPVRDRVLESVLAEPQPSKVEPDPSPGRSHRKARLVRQEPGRAGDGLLPSLPAPSPSPTPDPSPSPDPTPEPDPSPTPDPTPGPDPSPSPSPDPTPGPDPSPSP